MGKEHDSSIQERGRDKLSTSLIVWKTYQIVDPTLEEQAAFRNNRRTIYSY